MNVAAEINALEAYADLALEQAAKIKAYCQQLRNNTGGVSTPPKRKKKGSLSDKEQALIIAKRRLKRKIL